MKLLNLMTGLGFTLILVGCDQGAKGELDRSLATKILTDYLATPRVKELSLTESGMDSAEAEGLTTGKSSFTNKMLERSGAILTENRIYGIIGKNGWHFELKRPVGESVSEITGITNGGSVDTKVVECITRYQIPGELSPLSGKLFTGRKLSLQLMKYDDGWRVVGDGE